MTATLVISLSAVVLSTLTFIASQVGISRTAKQDYVRQLEQKVQYLEHELVEARKEIRELTRELIRSRNS